MAQTKINASQTTITAEDISAASVYSTMPTAAVGYLDKIVQYTGATDATYANGYFYKCGLITGSATISQTVGSGLSDIAIDVQTFQNTEHPTANETVSFVADTTTTDDIEYSSETLQVSGSATDFASVFYSTIGEPLSNYPEGTFVYDDSYVTWNLYVSGAVVAGVSIPPANFANGNITITGNVVGGSSFSYVYTPAGQICWKKSGTIVDLNDYGITYSGTPVVNDEITVVYTFAGYQWSQTNVQPQPVIPDPLPSQTGNAGKFLTTNGTAASWGDALINKNTAYYGLSVGFGPTNVAGATTVGKGATNSSAYSVCIGGQAIVGSNSSLGIAIGNAATIGNNANYAIQIGVGTNSDANTFKVGNENGNFEIMNANGKIPADRLTKVNSIITLAVADWNGGTTATKSITGITADGVVFVSPDPADQADYTSAGIYCSAQAAGQLTFTCDTTPTTDIDVSVVML